MSAKIAQKRSLARAQYNSYIIPIIFHVVHNGEPIGTGRNLSAAKIDSQLAQLNRDFANLSGSAYSVSANMQIQFCLAKVSPNGLVLSEPGIDRINSLSNGWNAPPYSITVIGSATLFNHLNHVDRTIIPESIWDPERYFNVWLLELEQAGPYGNSTFPIGSNLPGLFTFFPDTDVHSGVYLDYRCVGSIDNPGLYSTFAGLGRTLTHETGHFFGLRHIWGDSNCGDDHCADTPTQDKETTTCPTPQILPNNCNPPANKMYENYMDYTEDLCMNTFTEDQKIRMQVVMENSPRRAELAYSNVCCASSDLTIIGQSVLSSNVVAGDSTMVYFAEDNNGITASSPNYVSFHLSQDDVLTPGQNGDIYLGEFYIAQSLAPLSQTILFSKNLYIPSNIAAGVYYLFISADGAQNVQECNELNNFASVQISISDIIVPGQSNYYKLWFDNSYNSAIRFSIPSASVHNINRLIPTNNISNGLHAINFQFIKDTLSSSVVSTFFYKSTTPLYTGNGKYRFWLDENYNYSELRNTSNTNNLVMIDSLDMNMVSEGLHTLSFQFRPTNTLWSSTITSFFYKKRQNVSSDSRFQYWFDSNWRDTVSIAINNENYFVLNDALFNSLPNGIHTFNIRFKLNGDLWSSVISTFFYKADLQRGLSKLQFWYDDNIQDTVTMNIVNTNNYLFFDSLSIHSLASGLHTLNIRFKNDNTEWSSISTSFFYKEDKALIPINNLAKYIYWFDNSWQFPKAITITGIQNLSWTLNTDMSELTEGRHKISMIFKDDYGKWSPIVSDSFTRAPISVQTCLGGNRLFTSGIIANLNALYQWQVDTGNGFVNLIDNLIYSGSQSDTLRISNAPTSFYGSRYRCIVTNGFSNPVSEIYTLRFKNNWTGAVNSDWHNTGNWSCDSLPDQFTDVFINANAPNYPSISQNAFCRSLNLQPGATINVSTGNTLEITGD